MIIKGGSVYILTNKNKSTLYVGVTSNLIRRIQEHKNKIYPNSFSARYNVSYLIYYEWHPSINEAIMREKEIKKWRREKKEILVNKINPKWEDLWEKEVQYW